MTPSGTTAAEELSVFSLDSLVLMMMLLVADVPDNRR